VFGLAYAPGEVPLTPGETYALEFESLENYETLHGFVNIKGEVSDERPGFNPYRKHPRDPCAHGTAFKFGRDPQDFDLDLQILEYQSEAPNWAWATEPENLARNGTMEQGRPVPGQPGSPEAWKPFALDPNTAHRHLTEAPAYTNRLARVLAGDARKATVDGGWVQRVDGLEPAHTYRLSARLRASWPVDATHQVRLGLDPTGQDTDPEAPTVVWSPPLPAVHGRWVTHLSEPVRPATNALSLWLRARATGGGESFAPFKADFDDVALRRVRTDPPGAR